MLCLCLRNSRAYHLQFVFSAKLNEEKLPTHRRHHRLGLKAKTADTILCLIFLTVH